MNFGELLWWYLGNVRDYATQMLPCMCAAAAVYALALPARRRRLDRLGLVSPLRREIALLFCMMFGAAWPPDPVPGQLLAPAALAGRPAGERPLFPHWGTSTTSCSWCPSRRYEERCGGRGSCF